MDATPTLFDLLGQIPDPRRAEGKRHPLPAVLSLLVLAMLAGMRGLQGVVEFGRNLSPDVVAALGFTRTKTLAKSTLSEILRAIGGQPMASSPGQSTRLDGVGHRRQESPRLDGRATACGPPGRRLRARGPGRLGPTASRQQDQRTQGSPRTAWSVTSGPGGRHGRCDVHPRGFRLFSPISTMNHAARDDRWPT